MTQQWPPIMDSSLVTRQVPVTLSISLETSYTLHTYIKSHVYSNKSWCGNDRVSFRCSWDNLSKKLIISFLLCTAQTGVPCWCAAIVSTSSYRLYCVLHCCLCHWVGNSLLINHDICWSTSLSSSTVYNGTLKSRTGCATIYKLTLLIHFGFFCGTEIY